mmetsp:Transcript_21690/g.54602  ORF Transcript_21690/g.54602 Transcript_21690/m.54602 type:complete len:214 (+) Transcript_21690:388-1029(+)|eukprot:jgi/Tetstr1/445639/TSEL_003444.t1
MAAAAPARRSTPTTAPIVVSQVQESWRLAFPEYHLRRATPDDVEAVSELYAASYSQLLAADYEVDTLAAAMPTLATARPELLASGTFYVAIQNGGGGRMVGAGGWSPVQPHFAAGGGEEQPGLGHVRHFATCPGFTRRGVAKALLTTCMRDAAARGCTEMECFATYTGVPFYKSMGFRELAPKVFDFGNGVEFPGTQMRCSGITEALMHNEAA